MHALEKVADPLPRWAFTAAQRKRKALMQRRETIRIGIPRVMAMYAYAPLFTGYFESLGVAPGNIVFSDHTDDEMFRAGAKRGSIDPCYPSKLALAHIHNLIYVKHRRKQLDCIFFPMFDLLRTALVNMRATNACPTTALTPEVVKAAFTKEGMSSLKTASSICTRCWIFPDPICLPGRCSPPGARFWDCPSRRTCARSTRPTMP